MQDDKLFRTEVSSSDEYAVLPAVAEFSIDVSTAREILRLSAVVKAHGLYKVEKFDYRAQYLSHDDEEDSDQTDSDDDDDRFVRTEADTLNVSDRHFWFAAYLKHTDIEISSQQLPIGDLISHFNLAPDQESRDPSSTSPGCYRS
ncbi:hypothetical protein [Ottowia sp. VDI28]|uniref:hypothetical protein n=1 Tax=Ottowia sp. VDI28 TaxID=3133968 RepID=UPI003C2C9D0D